MLGILLLSSMMMFQDGSTTKPVQNPDYKQDQKQYEKQDEWQDKKKDQKQYEKQDKKDYQKKDQSQSEYGYKGISDEARELFLAADKATKSVMSAKYDCVREATGALASKVSTVKVHVLLASYEDGSLNIAVSGMSYGTKDGQPYVVKSKGAMTAEGAVRVDFTNEAIFEGPANVQALQPLSAAIVQEFGHPAPFSKDEINAAAATIEGTAFVGEVLCDVVWVDYGPNANNAQARWYFGTEDHLPRRVERLRPVDGRAGALVQTLYHLEVNFEVEESMFAIDRPEGFTVQEIDLSKFDD